MNLLEHGLSMERKDFLNLHHSLIQSMAFEYSLEQLRGPRSETDGQLVVSSPPDHPKSKPASGTLPDRPKSKPVSGKPPDHPKSKPVSGEPPNIEAQRRGGETHAAETTTHEGSPSKKRKAEDDSTTVTRRGRNVNPQATYPSALSLSAGPSRTTEVEPAEPFTTILRTKFGACLQRESSFLPGAEVFRRRRRMCAVYGQGLIDALRAEQNHKDDFNARLRDNVRSVYTFSQRQHDRNGNRYSLVELAVYLSGQLGLPLALYLETAEMATRVTTDWVTLYALYVETQVQAWYNLRAGAPGTPFRDDHGARDQIFEFLWTSEAVSGKFFDALRSLWLKVNTQDIL